VRVFYDGFWMHSVGNLVFPDSNHFEYHAGSFDAWPTQEAAYLAAAQDYWLHSYKPRFGDIIVDVGAGRGEDTLCFSRAVGPHGVVVAVEAHPHSFEMLERFTSLNHLRNVRLVNAAIADREAVFAIDSDAEWQYNSILRAADAAASGALSVPGTTLDLLLPALGLSRIDFLKMNIEGAEKLAVCGMDQTIERVDHVCIACHDFLADRGEAEAYRSRDIVIDFLTRRGLSVWRRTTDPRPSVRDYVYARR
jgi:FkbM family methyltransferase